MMALEHWVLGCREERKEDHGTMTKVGALKQP